MLDVFVGVECDGPGVEGEKDDSESVSVSSSSSECRTISALLELCLCFNCNMLRVVLPAAALLGEKFKFQLRGFQWRKFSTPGRFFT